MIKSRKKSWNCDSILYSNIWVKASFIWLELNYTAQKLHFEALCWFILWECSCDRRLQRDCTCVVSGLRHTGGPLLIWKSWFLLFLVPHPFQAVCGKIFTLCPIRSTFPWANRVFCCCCCCFFPTRVWGENSLFTRSPSGAFFSFLSLFLTGLEETLRRYSLGFPRGGRDKRSTYGSRGRKVRQPGVQPCQPSAMSRLTRIFGGPPMLHSWVKKDMNFHGSPIEGVLC